MNVKMMSVVVVVLATMIGAGCAAPSAPSSGKVSSKATACEKFADSGDWEAYGKCEADEAVKGLPTAGDDAAAVDVPSGKDDQSVDDSAADAPTTKPKPVDPPTPTKPVEDAKPAPKPVDPAAPPKTCNTSTSTVDDGSGPRCASNNKACKILNVTSNNSTGVCVISGPGKDDPNSCYNLCR
jgi:hypothetical protein